ncbi:MAG: endonuclease III [Bacillota bacterium]
MIKKENIKIIYKKLDEKYPKKFNGLNYNNTFELLIAVILSAQCTDIKVNKITPKLFKKNKTPQDLVDLGKKNIKKIIRPCGLSNSKSKYIYKTSQMLIEKFNSKVPNNLKDLMELSGVGRKTANVVLIEGFEVPRMPVDTHVFRVSNRIGVVDEKTVLKTEKKLMERVSKELWIRLHHLFISHGRATCKARNPQCETCIINNLCEYYKGVSDGEN